jgi:hypothetical protein
MNEVLIGATDNVVIRHSNGIHTATRCLQDMDAVKGPNVPDLGKSVSLSGQARAYLGPQDPAASLRACWRVGKGQKKL